MAFAHLLLTTNFVELNKTNRLGIVETSEWGIIEGEVPILSDSHAAKVNRALIQQARVSSTRVINLVGIAGDSMESGQAERLYDLALQEAPEARRVVSVDPNILVHVECLDAGPIDVGNLAKRLDEGQLRVRRGEDDPSTAPALERGAQYSGSRLRGGASHRRCIGVDLDLEIIEPLVNRGR
jgi:hypothetical protein